MYFHFSSKGLDFFLKVLCKSLAKKKKKRGVGGGVAFQPSVMGGSVNTCAAVPSSCPRLSAS